MRIVLSEDSLDAFEQFKKLGNLGDLVQFVDAYHYFAGKHFGDLLKKFAAGCRQPGQRERAVGQLFAARYFSGKILGRDGQLRAGADRALVFHHFDECLAPGLKTEFRLVPVQDPVPQDQSAHVEDRGDYDDEEQDADRGKGGEVSDLRVDRRAQGDRSGLNALLDFSQARGKPPEIVVVQAIEQRRGIIKNRRVIG